MKFLATSVSKSSNTPCTDDIWTFSLLHVVRSVAAAGSTSFIPKLSLCFRKGSAVTAGKHDLLMLLNMQNTNMLHSGTANEAPEC